MSIHNIYFWGMKNETIPLVKISIFGLSGDMAQKHIFYIGVLT